MERKIDEAVDGTEELDLEMIDLTEAVEDDAPRMAGACGGHAPFHSS